MTTATTTTTTTRHETATEAALSSADLLRGLGLQLIRSANAIDLRVSDESGAPTWAEAEGLERIARQIAREVMNLTRPDQPDSVLGVELLRDNCRAAGFNSRP